MAGTIYWRNPEFEDELKRALAEVVSGKGHEALVLLGTIDGPLNAEIARGVLEQEGIRVLLRQHTLGGIYGLTIGSFGAVRLYVLATQAEHAHEVLSGLNFGEG